MPEKKTMAEARKAKRQGKSPSTQAGAFVHEEIEHIREGKHGARSAKQAIAIGLSKARRAGVKLPPPPKSASARTKQGAKRDSARAGKTTRPSARDRGRRRRRWPRAEGVGIDGGPVAPGQGGREAAAGQSPQGRGEEGGPDASPPPDRKPHGGR